MAEVLWSDDKCVWAGADGQRRGKGRGGELYKLFLDPLSAPSNNLTNQANRVYVNR